ncbi:diaminopimelate epimerase [alpha proteobacterium Q-1]|nr:diaminopimelate epimerase [alpha proteobacterium Q-1]
MSQQKPDDRPFLKMHGLGNDFILFDARHSPLVLDPATVRALSDRHQGIGCDQLIILRPSDKADLFMEIRNADGSDVAACGNATRCVGQVLMDELGRDEAMIETRAGLLLARRAGDAVTVDMGQPGLSWRAIPLARDLDLDALPIIEGDLLPPSALSMGNPHLLFFNPAPEKWDENTPDVAEIGARLEHHPDFPEGTNVSFVTIIAPDHLKVRTWERGAGLTRACGTAACASLVGAHRRGFAARAARVEMPGGPLQIHWADDDHVLMTGAVRTAFRGTVNLADMAHD